MPSNKRFLGGLIGADPLRAKAGDSDWNDVTLLLDGTSPTDDLSNVNQDAGNYITNNGSVTTTSLTGPTGYGTVTALDFDGSTQYLSTTYYTASLYAQDFTIEGWFYVDSTAGVQVFFSHRDYSTNGVLAYITSSSTYSLAVGNGTAWQINTSGGSVTTGWHHIAVTRNGNDYVLWVDGASTASGTYSGTVTATGDFAIGTGQTSPPSLYFNGKVFDFRVTEGVARYTGPFSPPTSAFPTSSLTFQDPGNVDRVTANVGVLSLDTAGPENATLTEYTLADYTAYSETQLTASNNNTGDEFGQSCDMSGDGTIAVFGAPFEDGATNTTSNSGAVYVFENGTQVAILRASDSAAGAQFGFDVAISNDGSTIAVGANGRSSGGTYHTDGAVYVYEKPTNGWATTSSEDARLTHTAVSDSERLGQGVAISDNGDTIVVGRSGAQGGTAPNVVHVYERPTNGWANTSSSAVLSASNAQYGDDFGSGLAISGDGSVIAIGAPDEDTTQTNSGTVYVYEKPTNGWATATEDHFLGAPTRTFGAGFGYSCSLNEDGTILAVGEYDYGNGGRVLVLEYSGSSWSHSAALTAGTSGNAGTNVDISRDGTTVAAGDNTYNSKQGAIYIWLKPSSGWANSSYHRLITAANGSSNDSLGGSTGGSFQWNHCLTLSNDGGKVLSAAPEDDDTNVDSGSGFLFAATTTVPGSVSTTTKGSQWFWGGMRGRNAITTDSLVDTGVFSLSEGLSIAAVPPDSLSFIKEYTNLANGANASVDISSNASSELTVSSGDLLLCMEHGDNANTSEPGSVPSGFTRLAASSANKVWQRLSYKIAAGTETTLTAGLTGADNSSIHVLIFRSSTGSVSSVTPSTFNTESDEVNFPASPQSVAASNSTGDATVVFAAAGNRADVDFTGSSSLDAQYKTYNTGISSWASISGYALYNGAASDHSIDWSYSTDYRPTAVSGYLEVSF